MEEAKTIKKISKVNVPITILEVLCLALTIGATYYYGFSPASKAVELAYSNTYSMQTSDVTVALKSEKYEDYGYSEAQLDAIKQDLKCGIDVSKYAQKGQSLDEFIFARESVIESYDESCNRMKELHWKYGARFVISGILCGICMLWTLLEKVDRAEKYELSQHIQQF